MTFKWEQVDPAAPTLRSDFIICWIKDLLDPKAKQTRCNLKDNYGRCCLGVAVDTAKLPWNRDYGCFIVDDNIQDNNVLPRCIAEFLKMDNEGGFLNSLSYTGKADSLAYLNDKAYWNFRRIAKFIQKDCTALFEELSSEEITYIQSFKIPTRQQMRDEAKNSQS